MTGRALYAAILIGACGALATVPATAGTKGALYDFSPMFNEPHPFTTHGYVAPMTTPLSAVAPSRPIRAMPNVPVAMPSPTLRYTPPPGRAIMAGQPGPQTAQRVAASRWPGDSNAYYADEDGHWFDGFYVAIGGGVNFAGDLGERAPGGAQVDIEYDFGPAFDVAFGRYFGHFFRGELEFIYRLNESDVVKAGGATVSAGADLAISSLLLNGYFDFDLGWALRPYVGVGIGAASLDGDDVPVGGRNAAGKDTTELAYQGIIGVAWAFNRTWVAALDYRYFGTSDDEVSAQTILLSVRYNL